MRRASLAKPGGTVKYSIWVWSTVRSRDITASVSASGHAVDKPAFTLCPAVHKTTCSIGSLPAFQALEVLVTDHIGKKATAGEQIGLTVIVQGSAKSRRGGALSPAEATISAVLDPANPSPTVSPVVPGSPGVPGPFPTTTPGLPGTTVTPGGLNSLFPTVTPSSTPSSSNPVGHGRRKVTKATSTASSLPLDPRMIGGQLAGLAVLAAAIAMGMARLSLRTRQSAAAPQSGQPAGAAPPPQPSAAEGSASS